MSSATLELIISRATLELGTIARQGRDEINTDVQLIIADIRVGTKQRLSHAITWNYSDVPQ